MQLDALSLRAVFNCSMRGWNDSYIAALNDEVRSAPRSPRPPTSMTVPISQCHVLSGRVLPPGPVSAVAALGALHGEAAAGVCMLSADPAFWVGNPRITGGQASWKSLNAIMCCWRSLPAATIVPVAVQGVAMGTYALTSYFYALASYVAGLGVGAAGGPSSGASLTWPPCVHTVKSEAEAAAFLQATPNALACAQISIRLLY